MFGSRTLGVALALWGVAAVSGLLGLGLGAASAVLWLPVLQLAWVVPLAVVFPRDRPGLGLGALAWALSQIAVCTLLTGAFLQGWLRD